MSNENDNAGPAGPSTATKLGRQVRRTLLLTAVVVGMVAVFWIWERFRTEEFTVTVVAEPDPHEDLAGYPYAADGLLELMEFSARPSQNGPLLQLESHGDPYTWTFGVSGDDRRNVKNLRLRGTLTWPGSDVAGLSIPLSLPVDSKSASGRYELVLTTGTVQNFYDDTAIAISFKVTDRQSGVALPGLRRDGMEVQAFTETEHGIYDLSVNTGTLLQMAHDEVDSLTFRITQDADDRAAENLSLSVPLVWFFRRSAAHESRVLAIDFVTEVNTLCPRVTGLQPTRVRQDRWPDRLVITGEFLDRTESVSLRHRGREVVCSILLKTPTRLELTTGSVPVPGRYDVSLTGRGCESTVGGRVDVVAPSTPLRALPLATAAITRGDELALRWQRGSEKGPLVVEVSGPGGAGPWRSLGQAAATVEHFTWRQVDLEAGRYELRVRPVDGRSAAATWDLSITRPLEILVVIHFADGPKNWRISKAWIDGLEVTKDQWQATGSHARVRLALGEHIWVAKGRDGIAYTGSFVVESRHDFENTADFDLIRLDRAESKRRD